jgi:hypothetical protein
MTRRFDRFRLMLVRRIVEKRSKVPLRARKSSEHLQRGSGQPCDVGKALAILIARRRFHVGNLVDDACSMQQLFPLLDQARSAYVVGGLDIVG